jgi:hypothetical protein
LVRLKGKWVRDRFGWDRKGVATNGVLFEIVLYTIAYYGARGTVFGWSIRVASPSSRVGVQSKQGTDHFQNTREAKMWLDDKTRFAAEVIEEQTHG